MSVDLGGCEGVKGRNGEVSWEGCGEVGWTRLEANGAPGFVFYCLGVARLLPSALCRNRALVELL